MPDEASDLEAIQEAQRLLATIPEYDWLTQSTQPWFTVAEVAPHMSVSKETVRGWCEAGQIKHATLYQQQVGWRMPRSGLALFFAERVRERQQSAG
jgi:hypothetical protein